MNRGVLDSAANSSGPSVGASSLVTDANSAHSGNGPQLQHSTSINADSYLRLPASPMSFSSNNLSGSSVMDGSSIIQQTSQQEMLQKHGGSSVTSQPTAQDHSGNQFHIQKKMRMDMRQEEVLQQQMIQQLLQRQDSIHLQGHPSPLLQAMMQQPRLLQRPPQQLQQTQQIIQQLPLMQKAQLNQQQQIRPRFQKHVVSPAPPLRRPIGSGLCARRMLQYIYHQRHRPSDNSILYWRKFVMEYFAPRARKRWCLSVYDNVGNNSLGAFPQVTTDFLHCDLCGSNSGKGFEATFEVLPRLTQIKFDHGVVDELLFLDMPYESRLPSGLLVLEYAKVVQETVYEQLRVIREGQLRIIFSQELKILSWDFCERRHETFFPRRLVAPQVNQLLQAAQKYQTVVTENGSAGVPLQALQANCSMFAAAGQQILRSLDLSTLNDMGFSKKLVRSLQISEAINKMKDLVDYSLQNKTGPIESLKNYTQLLSSAKIQKQNMQDMEQLMTATQCVPEQNSLNKVLGSHPGLANSFGNNHSGSLMARVPNNGAPINNYHNLLRGSFGPNQQQESSYLAAFDSGQQKQDTYRGSSSVPANPVFVGGSPGAQLHHHQNNIHASSSEVNHKQQHMQHQAIQQLLQEMINKGGGAAAATPQILREMIVDGVAAGPPRHVGAPTNGPISSGPPLSHAPNPAPHHPAMLPSRNNSFKSIGSGSSAGENCFGSQQEATESGLLFPELDQEFLRELGESELFNW